MNRTKTIHSTRGQKNDNNNNNKSPTNQAWKEKKTKQKQEEAAVELQLSTKTEVAFNPPPRKKKEKKSIPWYHECPRSTAMNVKRQTKITEKKRGGGEVHVSATTVTVPLTPLFALPSLLGVQLLPSESEVPKSNPAHLTLYPPHRNTSRTKKEKARACKQKQTHKQKHESI